jgi:hypothetical protein
MKKNKQTSTTHYLMTRFYENMNIETIQNGFLKFRGLSSRVVGGVEWSFKKIK